MSRTIVFELNGFKLADIWLKARITGIGLNEAIVCEFQKEIKKRTKSKSIIPKISGVNRRLAETIIGYDLSEYFTENPHYITIRAKAW